MNHNQQKVYDFIFANPGADLHTVAKALYNRRVTECRACLQSLLWSGKIVAASGGYKAV